MHHNLGEPMKSLCLISIFLAAALQVPARAQGISPEMMVYGLVMSTGGCLVGRSSLRQERPQLVVEQDHEYCVKYTQSQSGYAKLSEAHRDKITELLAEQRQALVPVLTKPRW
jgi:hypothetical protein